MEEIQAESFPTHYIDFIASFVEAADALLSRSIGVVVSQAESAAECPSCGESLVNEFDDSALVEIGDEEWSELCLDGEMLRDYLLQWEYIESDDELEVRLRAARSRAQAARSSQLLDVAVSRVEEPRGVVLQIMSSSLTALAIEERATFAASEAVAIAIAARRQRLRLAPTTLPAWLREEMDKAEQARANMGGASSRSFRRKTDSLVHQLDRWVESGAPLFKFRFDDDEPFAEPLQETSLEAALLLRAEVEACLRESPQRTERLLAMRSITPIERLLSPPLAAIRKRVGKLYVYGHDDEVIIVARSYLEACLKSMAARGVFDVPRIVGERPDLNVHIRAAFDAGVLDRECRDAAHRIRRSANAVLHDPLGNEGGRNSLGVITDLFLLAPKLELAEADWQLDDNGE